MPGAGTAILNLSKAVNGCMLDLLGVWGVSDPQDLAAKAKERADKGEIDPIADVVNDRVYLFTGTSDRTVAPSIVRHAAAFYEKLGVPQTNIDLVSNLPAGHAFITDNEGNACGVSASPYIDNCNYDQAGALLKHIYGNLAPRAATPGGEFIDFDQRPFFPSDDSAGLAETGVVYIEVVQGHGKLPRSYCLPRLRTESRGRRRCVRQGIRLRAMGGHEPVHRAFSTNREFSDKPARLLGLVGLYGPAVSYA